MTSLRSFSTPKGRAERERDTNRVHRVTVTAPRVRVCCTGLTVVEQHGLRAGLSRGGQSLHQLRATAEVTQFVQCAAYPLYHEHKEQECGGLDRVWTDRPACCKGRTLSRTHLQDARRKGHVSFQTFLNLCTKQLVDINV